MTALEVRVRGINFAILELVAEVMGAKTISTFVASTRAVTTVPNAVTFFDVMACLSAPIAHLAVVLAPSVESSVTNCYQGSASSFALEVRGVVHVAIDASTNASDCVGSSESFGTSIHGKTFGLEGLLEGADASRELCGFGVVGAEILYFTLQGGVVLLFQGPVYEVSE